LALLPLMLLLTLLVGLSVVLRRWSTVPYWGAAHRLALASGVLAYFMLLAPLLEAATHPQDALLTLLFDAILALIVIKLARRAIVVIEIPGSLALPSRM
jgi:hypothetical protein